MQVNDVLADIEKANPYGANNGLTHETVANIFSRSKTVIVRIAGIDSEYYKEALNSINHRGTYDAPRIIKLHGVLRALKTDIEKGYLKTAHEIIQSEIFSDYIDMAEYLLSEGYKDAAAVIAGSTLEAHLKELAKSNNIDLILNQKQKKASSLNDDLTKAGVYSSAYQKQITAWLGIRNDAAHGNYSKYTAGQVDLMIQGIRLFTLK